MKVNTLKPNDLTMYELEAESWWSASNKTFKSLKAIAPFKLSILKTIWGDLSKKNVIDIGAGGGLLSVPLAREGANVIAIDISKASLSAAENEFLSQSTKGTLKTLVQDARTLSIDSESSDYVILADVVDHLPDYEKALGEASRILKKGGGLYVGTINRTFLSKIFAIYLGEGLGLIPKYTHDWSLFVKPKELISAAQERGLKVESIVGEKPDLIKTILEWRIYLKKTNSVKVAYGIFFRKL